KPIAWGVSSYDKWYNLIWFNNGYHAEYHFRPKLHWTKMQKFHEEILEAQRREGVRVITPPHALSFQDPGATRWWCPKLACPERMASSCCVKFVPLDPMRE